MRMAVGVTLFLVLALPWLAMPAHWGARRGLAVMAWRLLLRSFGIKVVVHGAPMPSAGTLYVANHISWTDIPVLGLVTRAAFVAKDDIRGWPVIGRLTTEYGCVFVEREARAGRRAGRRTRQPFGGGARSGVVS
jgi:1-acyl-sn-glycerol-3-phosphate acyltransferase